MSQCALLRQLYQQGQLQLAPEYQRNNVWPTPAKAYLIDTILNDKPIPLLFFQRITLAQSGRPAYSVIDGQQRLRAIFEFLDDRFRLSESNKVEPFYRKKFTELESKFQNQIFNYDLTIEELSGFDEDDITDMFLRMNRYVVKLSPQEMRHAKGHGAFHDFVEKLGKWDFWKKEKVFSIDQIKRMRSVEFAAELTILIIEGPQDKKKAIDLYYGQYQIKFPSALDVEKKLHEYLNWIRKAIPRFFKSRYRKPVDLYSIIGALHSIVLDRGNIRTLNLKDAGNRLIQFEKDIENGTSRSALASMYIMAASQQTDNIIPRNTRIDILKRVILS